MSTTTTTKPKIALAGLGQLGHPILTALLAASHPVIILSRSSSSSPPTNLPSSPLLTVAKVDYTSPDTITPHLTGVTVLISTLGSLAIDAQKPLIQAAYDAGVSRVIPSEFGSDTTHPKSSTLPVYAGKVAVQHQLKELSRASGGKFSYTIIQNNAFLDSGLTNGFIANVPAKKMTRYDRGDVPFSATRLSTIAEAVVSGVLGNLEGTRDRVLRIQDVRTTQNEVLRILGGEAGWEITEYDTKKEREEGFEELKSKGAKADFGKVMLGFVRSAAFAEGWGADFEEGERKTDNELLGVKGLSRGEWEEYVRGFKEGKEGGEAGL